MKIRRGHTKGFTLIELMIAFTLAGAILGSLSFLLITSLGARKSAVQLQTATFLAEQKLNEIKASTDGSSDSGEFEAFPEYAFEYDIEEIEIDPFSMASSSEEDIDEDNMSSDQALRAYQENSGGIDAPVSGILLRMIQYTVVIKYGYGKEYKLEMFRGLNVVAQ